MKFNFKKIFARLGIGLLVLVAVLFLIRAVFNFTNGQKMARYLENMQAEGIPLAIEELESDCPPENNASLEWKAAEELLNFETEDRKLLDKVTEDHFYRRPMSLEAKNRIRELVEQHKTALNLVKQAAQKPCFKYVEEWNSPLWEMRIFNATSMIHCMRLLSLEAVLLAEDGQVEEAIGLCLDLKDFLKSIHDEPYMISYLVSLACVKYVVVNLQAFVSGGEINEKSLQRIVLEMDPIPWRAGLKQALRAERIMGLEVMEMALQGKMLIDLDFSLWERYGLWLIRPILKTQVIDVMHTYDLMEEVGLTPFFKAQKLRKELENRLNSAPWYDVFTKNFVPNTATVALKLTILETMFQAARISAACKLYQHQQGQFPQKLDDLMPGIIDSLPTDPFTGEPFVYKSSEEGFMVYSLGSNQKDDEGRGTFRIDRLIMEKDDDWAWIELR